MLLIINALFPLSPTVQFCSASAQYCSQPASKSNRLSIKMDVMTALQKWSQNVSISPWWPAVVSIINSTPSILYKWKSIFNKYSHWQVHQPYLCWSCHFIEVILLLHFPSSYTVYDKDSWANWWRPNQSQKSKCYHANIVLCLLDL